MGLGIALNLGRRGFDVVGYDADSAARKRFRSEGGRVGESIHHAASGADFVVSVVVNADQTESILFGDHGALEVAAAGAIVISCATMAPEKARSLAARVCSAGYRYLDAPISGGSARAASGELTILCSGEADTVVSSRKVLESMASTIFDLGDEPGTGSAFKMINQLLAGIHIAAASEAIAFAAAHRLDLRKVFEVITRSAGNSWMFENRMPHVLDADYSPRSSVEIFVKDLGIVEDMARSERFPVPMASAALQMFLMTSASGMGKDDDASVARLYARIANISLNASSANGVEEISADAMQQV
jgi:3-hydroxyisobutyrate dehydrogenase